MQYEITGGTLPLLTCKLSDGESILAESGAMCWRSPNFNVRTNAGSSFGKMFSRAINGEAVFCCEYIAQGEGTIAFASEYPGKICVQSVEEKPIIICKSSFLASEKSVISELFWQKSLSSAMFGAEGFVLIRYSGEGKVFYEIDGTLAEYELAAGQTMLVSAGHLAAMDETCDIEIEPIKGIGNKLFGIDGLFNMAVKGPGRIWLQSMPRMKMLYSLNNMTNN